MNDEQICKLVSIWSFYYFNDHSIYINARDRILSHATSVKRCIKNIQLLFSLRGGAVAARWAHNPKVAGSSPAPATTHS